MSAKIIALFFLSVGLYSCKKEDPLLENYVKPAYNSTDYQLITSPGSYWIYEWYSVDANDISTPTGRMDSVIVVADSFFNAQNLTVLYTEDLSNSNSLLTFLKDSNNQVINENGKVLYDYENFNSVIATGAQANFALWSTQMYQHKYTFVPAGLISCIEARDTYRDLNGNPITNCGNQTISLSRFYAPGIGLVKEQSGYAQDLQNCSHYFEKRLVRYHIE